MPQPVRLITLALCLGLAAPATAAPATRAEDTGNEDLTPICQKPVKARGPGNTIKSVAELKAIIIWSSLVKKKHGQQSANWHHASNKSLKCKQNAGSQYYFCELKANPCHYQKLAEQNELSKTAPDSKPEAEKPKTP